MTTIIIKSCPSFAHPSFPQLLVGLRNLGFKYKGGQQNVHP